MGCAEFDARAFPRIEALPTEAHALLAAAPDVFSTPMWWSIVARHGIPAGAQAVFVVVRAAGRVAALVPMLKHGRAVAGLTTPYSCRYAPLLAEGLDQRQRTGAMAALARLCRGRGTIRLDALPAEWAELDDLCAGARAGGLVPLRFAHFGNWSEDVAGLSWDAFLERRPGALRETIRRRWRKAEALPGSCFTLLDNSGDAAQATSIFQSVYRRSWKRAEPYPYFHPALIAGLAGNGWLRLSAWWVGGVPVAAQLWVLKHGEATVLKLAHDSAFRAHSPGTVLTAWTLRRLLTHEPVGRVDWGRGDDPYKRDWASERRQRMGLLLANPRDPSGLAAILRHAAGRVRRAWNDGA